MEGPGVIRRFAGARHCGDTNREQGGNGIVRQVVTKTQDWQLGRLRSCAVRRGRPASYLPRYPAVVAHALSARRATGRELGYLLPVMAE